LFLVCAMVVTAAGQKKWNLRGGVKGYKEKKRIRVGASERSPTTREKKVLDWDFSP